MKTLIGCFFIFITYSISSQSVVLSTGGNFANNGSISFSVGQLITVPIQNASNLIYFGAQQPKELMALSVDEVLFDKMLVYPNPTFGTITINLDKLSNFPYQIQLFDIAGRTIITKNLVEPLSQIDISHISKGIYLMSINKNSKSIHHLKIIKK